MSLRPRTRIHLENIIANWRTLRASQQGKTVAAVVKANAYGHGLVE
ncbi:MAG: alanine racemase, partial [Pseudomonadota bacterium]